MYKIRFRIIQIIQIIRLLGYYRSRCIGKGCVKYGMHIVHAEVDYWQWLRAPTSIGQSSHLDHLASALIGIRPSPNGKKRGRQKKGKERKRSLERNPIPFYRLIFVSLTFNAPRQVDNVCTNQTTGFCVPGTWNTWNTFAFSILYCIYLEYREKSVHIQRSTMTKIKSISY